MTVRPDHLRFYASASMSDGTSGTAIGGAVDFSTKVTFADLAATGPVDAVSSDPSDTSVIVEVWGVEVNGNPASPVYTDIALNGTTVVSTDTANWRTLVGATLPGATGPLSPPSGGTSPVGNVAVLARTRTASGIAQSAAAAVGVTPALLKLAAGDGAKAKLGMVLRIDSGKGAAQVCEIIGLPSQYGTDTVAVFPDWTTVPDATSHYSFAPGMLLEKAPQAIKQVFRPFFNVAADAAGGATEIFYEKVFVSNQSTTDTLFSASVLKDADPAGLIAAGGALDFALSDSLNSTDTIANRNTAPTAIGSWSSGPAPTSGQGVAGGSLPFGGDAAGAQGIWLRLTLPPGTAPGSAGVSLRATGTAT